MTFMRYWLLLPVILNYALHHGSALPFTSAYQPRTLCRFPSCAASVAAPPLENPERFSRRAPLQRLPTGKDDLRRKTQKELMEWILQRTTEKEIEPIFPPEGEDKHRGLIIKLKYERHQWEAAIPTSRFKKLGNKPFQWAVQDMRGCTSLVVVREPNGDQNDRSGAVYMGHIWEQPGFEGDETEGIEEQFESFVPGFLEDGFPNIYIKGLAPDFDMRRVTRQPSLAEHSEALRGGKAIIIHPQFFPSFTNGEMEYGDRPVSSKPQYPQHLDKMESKIRAILGNRIAVERHLYIPNREGTAYADPAINRIGKILFQYDPNFDGRKTVMLLIGDGGPKGPIKADGTYGPGHGGPFFFDFGKAE